MERADHVRNNAGYRATETYGTNRANAFRLFEDCLNQRATQIFDTVEENGKEKRVLNKGETIAAREKQNKIKEAFADWIYADPHRREDLEKTYNRLFNQIRLPSYDGSFLKFPGMNRRSNFDRTRKTPWRVSRAWATVRFSITSWAAARAIRWRHPQ